MKFGLPVSDQRAIPTRRRIIAANPPLVNRYFHGSLPPLIEYEEAHIVIDIAQEIAYRNFQSVPAVRIRPNDNISRGIEIWKNPVCPG